MFFVLASGFMSLGLFLLIPVLIRIIPAILVEFVHLRAFIRTEFGEMVIFFLATYAGLAFLMTGTVLMVGLCIF